MTCICPININCICFNKFNFFIFFSNCILANEDNNNEVEVINLHESKTLDQMVLENLNNENNANEVVENTTTDEVDEDGNNIFIDNSELIRSFSARKLSKFLPLSCLGLAAECAQFGVPSVSR